MQGAKLQERPGRLFPAESKGENMASDITGTSKRIMSETDGVLWLFPDVSRTIPAAEFRQLFREYDTVCRAKRSVTLTKTVDGTSRDFHYKQGDALAATRLENEEKVISQLAKEGVSEDAIILSPGARRGGSSIIK